VVKTQELVLSTVGGGEAAVNEPCGAVGARRPHQDMDGGACPVRGLVAHTARRHAHALPHPRHTDGAQHRHAHALVMPLTETLNSLSRFHTVDNLDLAVLFK
jgi:hypothetical protein